MNFTIKNFKTFKGHDGDGFQCVVLVDGKPAFSVVDDGWGGGYMYEAVSPKTQPILDAAKSFARAQSKKTAMFPNGYPDQLDILISDVVSEYEMDKKLRRACKNNTVYTETADKDAEIYSYNRPFSPVIKASILVRNPKAVFINERYL